jgi:hypothetical protein
LEKEEWRYDKWPEFYLGKNVCDFYDAEIVKKLDALEKEEDEILKMEATTAEEQMSSDEDGITTKDLAAAVKKVRGKITILKQRHVLKAKRRAVSKIKNLDEMTMIERWRSLAENHNWAPKSSSGDGASSRETVSGAMSCSISAAG